jgi:hypothetical protein
LPPPGSKCAEGREGPADWQAAHARHAVHDALQKACKMHGLDDEQHKALSELVNKHLSGEAHNEGAAATDTDNTEENEELDELESKVKQYLENHGLDPVSVKQALEVMRRDRAAAVSDELPENARGGGPPIKQRLETDEELEQQYPGSAAVMYDPMGERPSNMSPDPVKALSERAMRKVAGGGTARRLETPRGASDAAFDEDIEAQIEREYGPGPGIGMFGRG